MTTYPSKQCRECGESKSIDSFYKSPRMRDGREWQCIACRRSSATRTRHADPEKYRAMSLGYYYNNHEARKAIGRERSRKVPAKEKTARQNRWIAKNPEKVSAHRAVETAIRRGELTRQTICEHCGGKARDGHHEDYSKPLEVIWLCVTCHNLVHRKAG